MRANVLFGLAAWLGVCTQARLVVATPEGLARRGPDACVTQLSDRQVLLGFPAHQLKAVLTDLAHRRVAYLRPPTTRCAGAGSVQSALDGRPVTGVAVFLVREPGMVVGNMVTSVGVWEIIRAPARYHLVALVKGDGPFRVFRSRAFSRGRLLGLKLPVVLERVRGALPIPDLRSLRSQRSAGRS